MTRISGKATARKAAPREWATYGRVLEASAIGRRENLFASTAARRAGTTIGTIRKTAPQLLTRDVFGRLVFTTADRLYRPVNVIQRGGGVVTAHTHGSRRATLAGEYSSALSKYRAGLAGPEVLARFEGKSVGGVELETDPDRIDDLDATGMLDDFEFYGDQP